MPAFSSEEQGLPPGPENNTPTTTGPVQGTGGKLAS